MDTISLLRHFSTTQYGTRTSSLVLYLRILFPLGKLWFIMSSKNPSYPVPLPRHKLQEAIYVSDEYPYVNNCPWDRIHQMSTFLKSNNPIRLMMSFNFISNTMLLKDKNIRWFSQVLEVLIQLEWLFSHYILTTTSCPLEHICSN